MKKIILLLLFIPTFAYCNWNDGLGQYTAEQTGGVVGAAIGSKFGGPIGQVL